MALVVTVIAAGAAAEVPPTVSAWGSLIAEASHRFGIPEPWIERVVAAESAGHTTRDGRPIRSRAGAIGLMQLMPATWAEMRDLNHLGSNPDDPHDNILAGTAYLSAMYGRFGYPGLFAAYNAGPARYATAIASGKRLPSETLGYLATVTGVPSSVPVTRQQAAMQSLFVVRHDQPTDPPPADAPTVERLFVARGTVSPGP